MTKCIHEVDPFLGVDGGGNCLPGPYRPLGMVRPGPDTEVEKTRNTNGYQTGLPIVRFSQVHVSGTGGGGRYGNISISPYIGERSFEYPHADASEEEAAPGYYNVVLLPAGIQVEITCGMRTGVYRIHYPASGTPRLLLDAGAALRAGGKAMDGAVFQIGAQEFGGWVELVGGWGHNHPYRIFFSLALSQPVRQFAQDGLRMDLEFDASVCVDVQVGISFISVEKAARNRRQETAGKTFEAIRSETEKLWEAVLGRVRINGGTPADRTLHYTMLYRLLSMPGDLGTDDEFPRWQSGVRHFTDFFCLWDSCRNANGFFDLAFPEIERDILNCLLDIGEHTGWLPDAWMSFHPGFMQGGCSADTLLGQAAQKELSGIDYRLALRLARRNHEETPPNRDVAGRYMDEFRQVGYVSTDVKFGCVSRHLEYTAQDGCIAQIARHLGDKKSARFFHESATNTMNLWHTAKRSFYPRKQNGDWAEDFDITQPFIQDGHYSADPFFFEGTAVEWSLTPLHVMDQIVLAHGGPESFVRHLDCFFSNWIYKWKEIILHTPYLYLYAGRPDRTADCLLEQRKRYGTGRNGLPDNEDMGSQSTFAICSGIGLYPIMGQDRYWLSPPLFDEVHISSGPDTTPLSITTDRDHPDACYITRTLLNGTPLNRNWIQHKELVNGGTLHFHLSKKTRR